MLVLDTQASNKAVKEIILDCRRTLTAVNRLLNGLDRADNLMERRRTSDGADTVFSREQNIIGELIEEQYDVYERATELLSVLRQRAPALFR